LPFLLRRIGGIDIYDPFGKLQRGFEAVRETGLDPFANDQAIDHHFDVMLVFLVERRGLFDIVEDTVDPDPVKFVINTHWHFDHSGGNENFGKSGSVIMAHDNVRKRMSTEQVMAALNQTFPPSPKAALPVVTFEDGLKEFLKS
jgi:glyoxylase-like metal-dependent hydrolase (beta-lactamase superfamily II)